MRISMCGPVGGIGPLATGRLVRSVSRGCGDVGKAPAAPRPPGYVGFEALASSSAGLAFSLGRSDGEATLDEVVEHTRAVNGATALPLSVDLENGYGPDPADAARAIERAASAGAVGGSIEDFDPEGRLYDIGHATERVAAAAEAARRLEFPFTFTARAENHIRGNPDLDDTIVRLQAYEAAGADVLYAPGLSDGEQIRSVREATSLPLNVLAFRGLSMAEIVDAGAQRISDLLAN